MSRKTKRNLPAPIERTQYLQITYEAPLPPPRMLEQYEHVLPGVADRLVKRMEAQSEHRHGLENRKIEADIKSEKRGQIFAFILAGLAIVGSFYLIATGKDRQGIYLFITTFASLVTVFIAGKVKQSWELARKRKEMKQLLPRQPELEK
jgi:uncharacterized membrane protein